MPLWMASVTKGFNARYRAVPLGVPHPRLAAARHPLSTKAARRYAARGEGATTIAATTAPTSSRADGAPWVVVVLPFAVAFAFPPRHCVERGMPKAGGEVSLRYRAGAVQLIGRNNKGANGGIVSMRGIARVRCNYHLVQQGASGGFNARYRASAVQRGQSCEGRKSHRFQCAVSRECGATWQDGNPVASRRFQCAVSRECGATALKKWPSAAHLGASTGQLESRFANPLKNTFLQPSKSPTFLPLGIKNTPKRLVEAPKWAIR
jgi:hypothetical protein